MIINNNNDNNNKLNSTLSVCHVSYNLINLNVFFVDPYFIFSKTHTIFDIFFYNRGCSGWSVTNSRVKPQITLTQCLVPIELSLKITLYILL